MPGSVAICLSVHLTVFLSFYLCVWFYCYLSVCSSHYLSIFLSVCLVLLLSICMFISLAVYLSICVPGTVAICLSVISVSVFLYTYLSICKPIVRIVIVRIPIPKFNFLLMLLTCRRASENVDCYPKLTKNLLCLYQGEKSSLYF